MPDEVDDRYLKYVVSRLAAFRNVWWSLANEYDFMTEKQESDWDRHDRRRAPTPIPTTGSPRSTTARCSTTTPIRGSRTPASRTARRPKRRAGRFCIRDVYRKPIVFDEIKYEGNIPLRWGNLSAEEMVHRFWECIIAGTYPGHGECYLHPRRRAVVVEGRRAARREPGADRVPARRS